MLNELGLVLRTRENRQSTAEATCIGFGLKLWPASLKCPRNEAEPVTQGDGRMKGSRFRKEQIMGILREHEAGPKRQDLRGRGISDATF